MHTDISLGSVANKNDATCLNVDGGGGGGGGGGGASPHCGSGAQQINKSTKKSLCVCLHQ